NSGQHGAFYIASPSTGPNVISVASVENPQLLVRQAKLSNGHSPITYYSVDPLAIPGSLPIYAISTDMTVSNDACSALPASTPDLSNYVVLIRRGGCSFVTKAANVKAKGAKYALIYNNIDAPTYTNTPGLAAALISKEDGAYFPLLQLLDQFVKNTGLKVSFPQDQSASLVASPSGGLISSFSAYGPTWDLEFKASVAAPGGNILSTLPRSQGSYGLLSGTSMATPFTAGAAALILQKQGKTKATALGVRALLESTGKAVPRSKKSTDPLQTLAQAGAGLLNVYEAVLGTTVVTPTELALNDTAYAQPSHTITVKNTSKKAQTYKITHVPAGTINPFTSDQQAVNYPVPLNNHYAKVTFSTSQLVVQPGKSAKFSATIKPPTGLDPKLFPVYSGFLKVASQVDSVHVAYMGVAGKMKDMKVWDRTEDYTDFPAIIFRLLSGTADLRIDLVSSSTKLTSRSSESLGATVPAARRSSRKRRHQRLSHNIRDGSLVSAPEGISLLTSRHVSELDARATQTNTFAKVPVVGNLLEGTYMGRNTDGSLDDNGYYNFTLASPSFSNGTAIPNGRYKFLLRALKITGNPKLEADYDAWLSPVFVVDYAH
ncbi:hypothetical protein FRB90_004733, partial [Tulasnella sp. 427]